MKALILIAGLIAGAAAHADIFLNCIENADHTWIDLSVDNWKGGTVQDGIRFKTVRDARARANNALNNGMQNLYQEGDVTGVVNEPRVVWLYVAKAPHIPAACVIWSGEPVLK